MKKYISILLLSSYLITTALYHNGNSYEFTNGNTDEQVNPDNEHEQEPGQFPDNKAKDS
ncbi:hypothetical protein [Paucisalibacillus sp. EB02]|uniref:hypothetical protein n=1 Tax=Paucisalibacillus sp. EB02 TaxID=1347087 RepID=UPI0004BBB526|nr:hypothetical protein [Paucisalibacillus sp. EB02]